MKALTLLLALLLLPFKVTWAGDNDITYEWLIEHGHAIDTTLTDSLLYYYGPPPDTCTIELISVGDTLEWVQVKVDTNIWTMKDEVFYPFRKVWVPLCDTTRWIIHVPCDSCYPGMQWRVGSVEGPPAGFPWIIGTDTVYFNKADLTPDEMEQWLKRADWNDNLDDTIHWPRIEDSLMLMPLLDAFADSVNKLTGEE